MLLDIDDQTLTSVLQRYRGWLSYVSYKPRWHFTVIEGHQAGLLAHCAPVLTARFEAPDADNPTSTATIKHWRELPIDVSSSLRFCKIIEDEIDFLHHHERDEWLCYGGKRLNDPHENSFSSRS